MTDSVGLRSMREAENIRHIDCVILVKSLYTLCSGSVVVTAYDSESGRPGSNPE